ncbi:hypothetical protein J7T55_013458 [Diaporthe amygdali]|uniref:uncharacterized protein n=1 Tax=Phomopsis amygdali TaxID=1214568 RepID=UPI0022FE8014|nr:uncharacterized protein J7T55_013458 [Diaporthe amygdali]KAJ0119221.1 hypothetical protein J7T55_013458 [Diaporthe amygdali]
MAIESPFDSRCSTSSPDQRILNDDRGAVPSFQEKTLKWTVRLGKWASAVITLGWTFEILILSFLLYLWTGEGSEPGGGHASSLWRWIMLKGYASQAVTVSAVVMRTAVGLQASICTALVAALMLEARSVQMSDIALFSVLRAVSGGPGDVVWPLLLSPSKIIRSAPMFLVFFLFVATFSSELTSTLLLADFRQTSLLDYSIAGHTPVFQSTPDMLLPSLNGSLSVAWSQAPQSYPPFAERVVQQPIISPLVRDTGLIRRAFLPFDGQSRQQIRYYDGPAFFYESRVVCSRPQLTGSIQYFFGEATKLWPRISGSLSLPTGGLANHSCPGGVQGCGDIPFNCALPFNFTDNIPSILEKQATVLCLFNETNQAANMASRGFRDDFSNLFLVLDTNSTYDDWVLLNQTATAHNITSEGFTGSPGPAIPAMTNYRDTDSGEWAVYDFSKSLSFRATACQSYINVDFENITASSHGNSREPILNYDATAKTWITDDILKLAGVGDNVEDNDRGILEMSRSSAFTKADLQIMLENTTSFEPLNETKAANGHSIVKQFRFFLMKDIKGGVLTAQLPWNFSVYFCSQCQLAGNMVDPHFTMSILFHAILRKTDSVAPSFQNVMFWLAQTQYYNALPGFDFGGNTTLTFSNVQYGMCGHNNVAFPSTSQVFILRTDLAYDRSDHLARHASSPRKVHICN